jgi:hypothetical protein
MVGWRNKKFQKKVTPSRFKSRSSLSKLGQKAEKKKINPPPKTSKSEWSKAWPPKEMGGGQSLALMTLTRISGSRATNNPNPSEPGVPSRRAEPPERALPKAWKNSGSKLLRSMFWLKISQRFAQIFWTGITPFTPHFYLSHCRGSALQ